MHSEHLKYEFSEGELKSFSRELARENTAVAEFEEQKKAVMASFAEKITMAKSTISRLSRFINNGYDYRLIDCDFFLNQPRAGRKELVRTDTGEVVREVAMTEAELQESLPFEAPAAPAIDDDSPPF